MGRARQGLGRLGQREASRGFPGFPWHPGLPWGFAGVPRGSRGGRVFCRGPARFLRSRPAPPRTPQRVQRNFSNLRGLKDSRKTPEGTQKSHRRNPPRAPRNAQKVSSAPSNISCFLEKYMASFFPELRFFIHVQFLKRTLVYQYTDALIRSYRNTIFAKLRTELPDRVPPSQGSRFQQQAESFEPEFVLNVGCFLLDPAFLVLYISSTLLSFELCALCEIRIQSWSRATNFLLSEANSFC